MRESMSRPSRSVPSGYCQLPRSSHTGGRNRLRSDCSSGSAGLMKGARMAMRTNIVMMPRGMTGSPRSRSLLHARGSATGKAVALSIGSTRMAYPRVDDRVEQIDPEVDHGHDGRGGQDHRLDDGEIAGRDALIGEPPQPRPGEDRLHHDGGGDEDGEVDARERHHGDERVLERVEPHDPTLDHALDAGQLDVLRIEHLEHPGAEESP